MNTNSARHMRQGVKALSKKIVFDRSGHRCAFPGCGVDLVTTDGLLLGEICHIEAMVPGGPRYNSLGLTNEIDSPENLIALCPTHHKIIDSQPEIYTAEWLWRTKENHERRQQHVVADLRVEAQLLPDVAMSLLDAISLWESNRENADEEFWQRLFKANPFLIAQAIPNHVVQIGQKSYVGGKGIDNRGGNVVDFLYATKSTKNVVVVEIKTPMTELVGRQYRASAFSISEELTGAIVQSLNYRDELIKNYAQLSAASDLQFTAFNPACFILAGTVATGKLSGGERKSLELFRSAQQVSIVGYDELFAKLQDLVDLLS